uniref:ADP-ribosylation factor-like 9 n=1 Tax=Lepisosteus oculatus TaxID=7918 RepID=W5M3U6_LEPOC
MPGFREAGLLGAAFAATGGVAYVFWRYLSSREHEEKVKAGTVGEQPLFTEVTPSEQTVRISLLTIPLVLSYYEVNLPGRVLVRSASKQVLVLGLDGAGKTSVLHCLATGTVKNSASPTEGFNAVCINKEDTQIEFIEKVGGSESLRTYWNMYLSKAQVLVYVVDAADPDRFPLAKKHLHELIREDSYLPLVVLGNKQDLQGACSIMELHDALSLDEVGDERKLYIIGTHVRKSDSEVPSSVQDARELITQLVTERK